jgi:uncharacterized Zn ribbon protein
MRSRAGLYILCSLLCIPLFISCLGDSDDVVDTVAPDDAEILSFYLSHDSIPNLAKVKFSIDQVNGRIYNHDSLPYLTNIQEKVIVSYTNSLSITNVQNVTDGDSTWIASGDSVDVSKPLRLKVFSLNGTKTKFYDLRINIHQVDPDSVQYKQLELSSPFLDNVPDNKTILFNGSYYAFVYVAPPTVDPGYISLYKSADMRNWGSVTLTGLPFDTNIKNIQIVGDSLLAHTFTGNIYVSHDVLTWNKIDVEYFVKSILGSSNGSSIQPAGLSLIVDNNKGAPVFAFTSNFQTWQEGSTIPSDFPLSDFSVIKGQSSTIEKVTLVGGKSSSGEVLNTVWSTQDGIYWVKLNDTKKSPLIEGGNAFLYDNEIYWLNGKLGDGSYNKNVYFSIDGGVTWKIKADKYSPSENYPLRYNASVVTDDTYFYIVGGHNDGILTDVWQAFINRKLF